MKQHICNMKLKKTLKILTKSKNELFIHLYLLFPNIIFIHIHCIYMIQINSFIFLEIVLVENWKMSSSFSVKDSEVAFCLCFSCYSFQYLILDWMLCLISGNYFANVICNFAIDSKLFIEIAVCICVCNLCSSAHC